MKKHLHCLFFLLTFLLPFGSAAQVTFTAQSASMNCETNSFSVDVVVDNFTTMNAFQYTIHWDPTVLDHLSFTNNNYGISLGSAASQLDNGFSQVSWFSTSGTGSTNIPNGTTVFTITFNVIGAASNSSIFFNGNPSPIELIQNGAPIDPSQYAFANGTITFTDSVSPVANCPSDITVDSGGSTTAQVPGISPSASDNCGIEVYNYTLSGATTGAGSGDVSNNVNFNIGTTTVNYAAVDFGGNSDNCSFDVTVENNTSSNGLEIFGQQVNVDCENNMVSVDIIANNFTDLKGAQFTLNWNSTALEYIDTSNIVFTNGALFGVGNANNGNLTFSWFNSTPLSFPNDQVLFTLNFNLNISQAGLSIPIPFINAPTFIQFIDENNNALPATGYTLTNGLISIIDTEGPTLSCPNNVTVDAGTGTTAIVNSIALTAAADNCGIADTTYTLSGVTTGSGNGDASGTTFNLGATTVNYTITDFGGNAVNCDFIVTVTNSPVQMISVDIDELDLFCNDNSGEVCIRVNDFNDIRGIQFTINWDPTEIQYSDTSNINLSNSNFGINNASTGVLTYSWFSTSAPVSLADGTSLFCINFDLVNPTINDSYDVVFANAPTPVQVVTQASFPNFLPTSEYTIADGNIEILGDTELPIISCPTNVTIDAGTSSSVAVNNLAPTASDNCGAPDVTYALTGATTGSGNTDASGSLFNVGVTTVSYIATDDAGNSVVCNFDVTISNSQSQFISISIDSLELDCNDSGAQVCIRVNNFEDIRGVQFTINWDDSEIQYADTSNINFGTSNFGTLNVNSGVLTYSWFSTAGPVTLADGTSLFCINFDLINPIAGDSYDLNFSNFPTPVQVVTQASFPNFLPVSDYVISNGNIVILADTQAPSLTCPSDVTVDAGTASSMAVNGLAPTVSDNCGAPTVTYNLTGATTGSGNNDASSMIFNLGVTTVTYTAVDAAGNSITCSVDVTVTNIPSQLPVISIDSLELGCNDTQAQVCIKVENFEDIRGIQFTLNWNNSQLEYLDTSNITLTNSNFGTISASSGVMTYSWFSTGGPITLIDGATLFCLNFDLVNPSAGDSYNVDFSNFPTPVQLTTQSSLPNPLPVTDYVISNGNIIIVPDTQAPTLTCPMDVTVSAGTASSIAVNGLAPSSSDNCGVPSVTYELTGATTGTGSNDASSLLYNTGITSVTYTATDNSGNIETCNFTVTVETNSVNVIDINLDSLTLDCGINTAELCVRVNNFDDVRGVQFTLNWDPTELTFDNTSQVVLNNPSFGTNNTATGTMTFSWFSSSSPVTLSDGSAIFCINFTLVSPFPGNDFDVNFDFNGSTPFQIITQSSLPNILAPSSYNTIDGNIMITPDTQAPMLDCPDDVTINSNGAASIIVNNIAPTTSDDCGSPIAIFNLSGATTGVGAADASGMLFNVGVTTVNYSSFDASGNSVSCSFNVTVIQEVLSITCPPNVLVPSDFNTCTAAISNLALTVNSNMANIASVSYIITPEGVTGLGGVINHTFELGTSLVTFNVVDIFGDSISCFFNVSVTDSEAPVISGCPSDISVNSAVNCEASVNYTPPTAIDNCDSNVTVVCSHPSGTIFPGGTTEVICVATDIFNNSDTCFFNVTVVDNIPPSLLCPADVTVNIGGTVVDPNNFIAGAMMIGCDSVILDYNTPQGTDNCLNWTITSDTPDSTAFGAGVNTFVFTITDDAGNMSTCAVNVTIIAQNSFSIAATPNPVCVGGTVNLEIFPASTSATYNWEGPNGPFSTLPNPIITDFMLSDTGIYTVTVIDSSACDTITILTVDISALDSPDITIISDPETLECIDGVQDVILSASTMDNITSWEWLDPDGVSVGTDSSLMITVDPNSTGTYTLLATGDNGCITTVMYPIIVSSSIETPVITSSCNEGICVGDACTYFGMFAGSVDSVLWESNSPNLGLPTVTNTNTIEINPIAGGAYSLSFTIFKDGCSETATVPVGITFPAMVTPDIIEVTAGEPITFSVVINDSIPPGFTIADITELSNGGTLINNLDGTFNYTPPSDFLGGTDMFIYEICVQCNGGEFCVNASVTLNISSDGCLIPTIITPNGDGMNDEWQIACAVNNTENELTVYNRWGDKVYEAAPYQNDWKGTYNNEDLPDGTYYYIYKNTASDTDPKKGYLTIMR